VGHSFNPILPITRVQVHARSIDTAFNAIVSALVKKCPHINR